MQLMGIAFRLRSASYGGRSRSLSCGGQVAQPILRASAEEAELGQSGDRVAPPFSSG